VRPAGEPLQAVLLLSGQDGVGPRKREIAAALANGGAFVFEIDTHRYLQAFSAGKGRYIEPAGDFENLSQFGQMQYGLASYRPPVLVGVGVGATLAYAALAEGPRGIFSGAVSLGFCPVLQAGRPLYHGTGLRWDRTWKGPGWRLLPDRHLARPWIEIETPSPTAAAECPVAPDPGFAAATPNATRIALPGAASPDAAQDAWRGQLAQALALIAARPKDASETLSGELADLPLVEVPAAAPESDVLAVEVSGSGGWEGLDVDLGKALAEHGVPTVGISSLDYFWKVRDPDGAARDLSRILEHFLTAWHKSEAVVLGYSQGADVVPFMVARLPAKLRSRVAVVGLIGPDGEAEFDLGRGAFMRRRTVAKPFPVAPEIPRLHGAKLVCVYGRHEIAPLCPHLGAKITADVVALPGGHGFRNSVPVIVDHLLAAARSANAQAAKTTATSPSP